MRRRERHAQTPVDPAAGLRTAVAGLTSALDAGGDQLPAVHVADAERALRKASERLSLSGDHTVVSLAGATGTGKSSLFNALAGQTVSQVGALRPTTSRVTAAIWGHDAPDSLLDWVGAAVRHRVPTTTSSPSPGASADHAATSTGTIDPTGLVLLDLPDIDSFVAEHREDADRVLELTDVFVWVADPQKYADALWHDTYLRAADRHQAVTLVVLNQADRVAPAEVHACREDLRHLLTDDGLTSAEVLVTSTRTGQGVGELRDALYGATHAATAARARLVADLQRQADTLAPHVGANEPGIDITLDDDLVDTLCRTAGIPVLVDSVAADYRRRAAALTSWPFLAWTNRLGRDPLTRLTRDTKGEAGEDVAHLLAQRTPPCPSPTARAAVDRATRSFGARAAHGLPGRWAQAVHDAATPDEHRLARALDDAVTVTPLTERTPLWWYLVATCQWLFALAVVAGAAWFALLAVCGIFGIPTPEAPEVSSMPIHWLLLAVGVTGGLVLTLAVRPIVGFAARRRRERAHTRLRAAVVQVAQDELVSPVTEVLERHRRTREQLALVRSV
ncbi:tRNA modification GTPase MnmE [Austwickia sp. TVS 96-490-7B]|uniref:GTPase n=1 Tax=Austwickia sp. TVS 96-490-7B TaxID=2830843 RepID=UPI001C58D273|nr:GTPase [Austwickia sp. TVS 96-490-7B]MBW3086536.1 tRNA modification GTPase MnmE [Austwickia sp. TVS 96-490-7B]